MYQFHFKFTEGKSYVKHWSSFNLKITCKILTELWPFFDFIFASILVFGSMVVEEIDHFHSKFTIV